MRSTRAIALLTFALGLLLVLAPETLARGGRFAGPAAARPVAPPQGGGGSGGSGNGQPGTFVRPGDDYSGQIPMPPPPPRPIPLPPLGGGAPGRQPGAAGGGGLGPVPAPSAGQEPSQGAGACCGSAGAAPVVPEAENASGVGSIGLEGRKRAGSRGRVPGLDDWVYWYEVNREQFEDLRAGAYVTEGNPLFGLGAAAGERAGRVERRLDPRRFALLKTAVRDVLATKQDEHWVYTEGAAYVALGKIAARDEEVEFLTRALLDHDRGTQFVRESAALGLGQLRRSEARRQLPGTTLDRVRDVLERVLDDDGFATRTRAFAALSLGLLADQPSTDGSAGRRTARTLFASWVKQSMPDETQVGVLMGLGLVGPEHVGSLERLGLRACLTGTRRERRTCSSLVRAQAALTLGRVGTAEDAQVLLEVLGRRSLGSPSVRQAAVLAAAVLGRRVPGVRLSLAEAALEAGARAKEPAARRLARISAAQLLAVQAAEGGADGARAFKIASALRRAAEDGSAGDRAFAALALGLAARGVDELMEKEDWQRMRHKALVGLREGLEDKALGGHARAAFATALGIARDSGSTTRLLEVLRDEDTDPDLRAYAALGLGLLGKARQDVLVAVRDALEDARSDRLRMNAATAIGLLGGGGTKERERTLEILLREFERTRNQNVKGQIAITLARIGDVRAVGPLVSTLETGKETHMNRSLACAALGLLGDEERTPVLSAARRDSHYTGGSSVLFEVLDVL